MCPHKPLCHSMLFVSFPSRARNIAPGTTCERQPSGFGQAKAHPRADIAGLLHAGAAPQSAAPPHPVSRVKRLATVPLVDTGSTRNSQLVVPIEGLNDLRIITGVRKAVGIEYANEIFVAEIGVAPDLFETAIHQSGVFITERVLLALGVLVDDNELTDVFRPRNLRQPLARSVGRSIFDNHPNIDSDILLFDRAKQPVDIVDLVPQWR